MAALLEVKELSAGYGSTPVLQGVGLEVAEGGITTVLGANGAGKTTLLRALCGMIKTVGQIRLHGKAISGRATEDIVRLGVAHVPDGRGTFLDLTTEENLKLGAYTRKDRKAGGRGLRACVRTFRGCGAASSQAGTYRAGSSRCSQSRARSCCVRLLLLDEPSFGLAPLVVQDIFRIMRRINQEDGVSMLLVEQNATLALDLRRSCLPAGNRTRGRVRSVVGDPQRRGSAAVLSGVLKVKWVKSEESGCVNTKPLKAFPPSACIQILSPAYWGRARNEGLTLHSSPFTQSPECKCSTNTTTTTR
jgi:branched-chain amino acid transport system ATP-binding protein